jgi:hypothetical protein
MFMSEIGNRSAAAKFWRWFMMSRLPVGGIGSTTVRTIMIDLIFGITNL